MANELATELTLRDYFAAAVLPQIMTRESILGAPEIAYRVADEMLRARKNDNPSDSTPPG